MRICLPLVVCTVLGLLLVGCASLPGGRQDYPPAIPEPPAVLHPDPWKELPPSQPAAPPPPALTAEEQATWDRLELAPPTSPPKPAAPKTVVAEANKTAQIDPTMERYNGGKRARQVYPFVDGAVYKVLVGTMSEVTLLLPRGERLAMEVVDVLNPELWLAILAEVGEGTTRQEVLKLLAFTPGQKKTTSLVLKSGKVLYLALESVEHTGMVAVSWEMPRLLTQAASVPQEVRLAPTGLKAPKIDISRLHRHYSWQTVKGVSPYEIGDVLDDGYLTLIKFQQSLSYTAAPTVHIRYVDGSVGPVNASPYTDPAHPEKGMWYILQGIYPAIELRGPDKVMIEIVRQAAPTSPVMTTEHPR